MKPLTKSVLVGLLAEKGIKTYRALGQNFLIDPNFLKSIPRAAGLTPEDYVLEIGAGPGILTRYLAHHARHVWAVEIDKRFMESFKTLTQGLANLTLFNNDFLTRNGSQINPLIQDHILQYLKVQEATAKPAALSIKVVSNLPYARATDIILALLESPLPIQSMTVMIQKEAANKLKALPQTHAYQIASVLTQTLATVKVIKSVPAQVFWPKPRITSALVSIIPQPNARVNNAYLVLKKIVIAAFKQRRKKIGPVLQKTFPQLTDKQWGLIIKTSGLSTNHRPTQISPQSYQRLARQISV